jgi:hypothetical protein
MWLFAGPRPYRLNAPSSFATAATQAAPRITNIDDVAYLQFPYPNAEDVDMREYEMGQCDAVRYRKEHHR